MIQKQKNKSGFSLVEVMITLFIIAAVLVLYIAAVNTMRITKITKHQEIALRVANNKIEELRAGGYDSLPSSGNFSNSQLSTLPNSSGTMSITSLNADSKQVQVDVEWREPENSVSRTISLTTIITKTGGL